MTVEQDLADIERRLDRLHAGYLARMQREGWGLTRAQTTSYNARVGQLCQRRDELRKMLGRTQ